MGDMEGREMAEAVNGKYRGDWRADDVLNRNAGGGRKRAKAIWGSLNVEIQRRGPVEEVLHREYSGEEQ